MKKWIAILLAGLTVCAYAEEAQKANEDHRIYFEPDFSWNLAHKYNFEGQSLKEWGQYYGLNVGYEFFRPNFIYAGVDGFLSVGNRFLELKTQQQQTFDAKMQSSRNRIEGRLGYTLQHGPFILVPFTGSGGYFISQGDEELNVAYIPIGIQGEYRWSQFSIGLKGEQMHYVHSWRTFGDEVESANAWAPGSFGYEVALPISFRTNGSGGEWFAAFEPYYLRLFDDFSFLGGRISASHQF